MAVTKSKMTDILRFLDEVEMAETSSAVGSVDGSQFNSPNKTNPVPELRRKMDSLRQDLQKRTSQVGVLRKKLQELRTKEGAREQEMQKQTAEWEAGVSRHMQFITTLIADKEALTAQVEALNQDIKVLMQSHEQKVEELQGRVSEQSTAERAQWEAAEKRRRQAWKEEQTRLIKNQTLKSLEPEIAHLMTRHKSEKQRLEDDYAEQLRRRDAALAQKEKEWVEEKRWLEEAKARETAAKNAVQEQKHRELLEQRTRLAREYEQSLAQEREHFQLQTKEQGDRFERRVEEVRAALRDAKERESEACRRFEQELDSEKAKLRAEKSSQVAAIEEKLRAGLEAELQARCQGAREELAVRAAEEAQQLRKQLEEERDQQIDLVIRRLEDSAVQTQRATGALERAWKEKYNRVLGEKEALATRVEAAEDEQARASAALGHAQQQVAEKTAALERIAGEHAGDLRDLEVRLLLRLEKAEDCWGAKCTAKTAMVDEQAATIKALRKELEFAREAHARREEEVHQQHEAELEKLKERVQQALVKKEASIKRLQTLVAKSSRRTKEIAAVVLSEGR